MSAREIAIRNAESKRQRKTIETARICLCPRCEAKRRREERRA